MWNSSFLPPVWSHPLSPVCYSQMGERRQVFKGSFWYQRYVVAMERPGKMRETWWGGTAFGLEYTPGECGRRFPAWVEMNSQQSERLESVERPHWDAAQAVVAQDALHTKTTCWHGHTLKRVGHLKNACLDCVVVTRLSSAGKAANAKHTRAPCSQILSLSCWFYVCVAALNVVFKNCEHKWRCST